MSLDENGEDDSMVQSPTSSLFVVVCRDIEEGVVGSYWKMGGVVVSKAERISPRITKREQREKDTTPFIPYPIKMVSSIRRHIRHDRGDTIAHLARILEEEEARDTTVQNVIRVGIGTATPTTRSSPFGKNNRSSPIVVAPPIRVVNCEMEEKKGTLGSVTLFDFDLLHNTFFSPASRFFVKGSNERKGDCEELLGIAHTKQHL